MNQPVVGGYVSLDNRGVVDAHLITQGGENHQITLGCGCQALSRQLRSRQ